MNNLTGLIPILFAALQVVSRELVGAIPAASRDMRASQAALNQIVRVPITPPSENQDIVPGTPPSNGGTDFGYIDVAITKNRIAKPIVWNGDEEISVGNQLNQMLVNQYTQAMRSLVNEMEKDLCAEMVIGALSEGKVYGTAGTTPFASNLADLAQLKKIMDDTGAPLADRHLVLNTAAGAALRTLEKLTNVNQAGENTLLRQGIINELMGYAIRETAGYVTLTPGTQAALAVSAEAAIGDKVLVVTALTGTLKKGAILTIGANKYAVMNDYEAGSTTIAISPALKTVVAAETDITVGAAYTPSVAFSRDFILTVSRAPAMPQGGDDAKDVITITDPVSNLSFQVALYGAYRQTRVEVGLAWGQKAVNPSHGVVLLG
jgi:hypothetical protein